MFSYITRLLLLAVYASFFVVQSFYSLKNSIGISDFSSQNFKTANTAQQSIKSIASKKNNPKQTNVRLNKRFQPEAILSYAYKALPEALSHNARYNGAKPIAYLLHSSILADSLRGPPSMG